MERKALNFADCRHLATLTTGPHAARPSGPLPASAPAAATDATNAATARCPPALRARRRGGGGPGGDPGSPGPGGGRPEQRVPAPDGRAAAAAGG